MVRGRPPLPGRPPLSGRLPLPGRPNPQTSTQSLPSGPGARFRFRHATADRSSRSPPPPAPAQVCIQPHADRLSAECDARFAALAAGDGPGAALLRLGQDPPPAAPGPRRAATPEPDLGGDAVLRPGRDADRLWSRARTRPESPLVRPAAPDGPSESEASLGPEIGAGGLAGGGIPCAADAAVSVGSSDPSHAERHDPSHATMPTSGGELPGPLSPPAPSLPSADDAAGVPSAAEPPAAAAAAAPVRLAGSESPGLRPSAQWGAHRRFLPTAPDAPDTPGGRHGPISSPAAASHHPVLSGAALAAAAAVAEAAAEAAADAAGEATEAPVSHERHIQSAGAQLLGLRGGGGPPADPSRPAAPRDLGWEPGSPGGARLWRRGGTPEPWERQGRTESAGARQLSRCVDRQDHPEVLAGPARPALLARILSL